MKTRVVLAEDNALLRHGLVRLVQAAEDLTLVGSAADLPTLLGLIESETPDVVVTDIRMPPTHTDEGISVAAQLRTERPDIGVVLLSQYAEASYALRAARRRLGPPRLPAQGAGRRRRRAHRGHPARRRRRLGHRPHGGRGAGRGQPGDAVGARLADARASCEVLGEMAQGKSNAAIAASLVLSERAIEKHTNSIFSKLGLSEERDLNRRVSAVLVYLHER